ncbi:unnamed protein product [Anisakis simplex]|uniref:Hcy-binding domain-containing protein n=1 Tax=Anisakis simplex TaxID=6269 RepID=A0A0M3JUM4_ANISI|nr:unnamed protein product [Anisakis simplex]
MCAARSVQAPTATELWKKIRVLDGGTGSELDRICKAKSEKDPLWSAAAILDDPQSVINVHKSFIASGCDVLLSNTYHADIGTLMQSRHLSKCSAEEVIRKGVDLVREAVKEFETETAPNDGRKNRHIEIVGSIGPFATTLSDCSEYNGHYVDEVAYETLVSYYVGQLKAILTSGLKMFAFETIPSMVEGRAVLTAIDSIAEDVKCWISFSCRDGERTNHNERFCDVVRQVSLHPDVVAVGINCTAPIHISSLLQSARDCSNGKPFVVYPNSGEKYDVQTASCCLMFTIASSFSWTDSEMSFADVVSRDLKEWIKLGVRLRWYCIYRFILLYWCERISVAFDRVSWVAFTSEVLIFLFPPVV